MIVFKNNAGILVYQFPGPEPIWITRELERMGREDILWEITRFPKGMEIYRWEPMHPELKERQFRTVSCIDCIATHIYEAEKAVLYKYPLLYNSQRDWRFTGTRRLI